MPPLLLEPSMRSRNFGSAGKNRNSPSTTRFSATKLQVADAQNRGLVDRPQFFTALPESLDGSMRQISGLSSTSPSSCKETAGRSVAAIWCGWHVKNLPHTSGLGAHLALSSLPHPLKMFLNSLKGAPARVDSVQYACLTMTNVELRGGVRHGGTGCWQHRICRR